jgi:hypothetical protein
MGKYLELIKNLNVTQPNFNFSLDSDTFTQATTTANDFTNGWLGLGVLIPIWFGIFQTISQRENMFELSQLQAVISTNSIILTLAVILVYLEILTSIQHFIIIAVITFIINIIGILKQG